MPSNDTRYRVSPVARIWQACVTALAFTARPAMAASLQRPAAAGPLVSKGMSNHTHQDLLEYAHSHDIRGHLYRYWPGRKNICIVDVHMPADEVYANVSTENHGKYAKRHGYQHYSFRGRVSGPHFVNPDHGPLTDRFGGGFYYQKIAALAGVATIERDGASACLWMFWIDTDAIFTNFPATIESIINHFAELVPQKKDVVLSRENTKFKDSFVNSGVFLVKNSEYGRKFLSEVAKLHRKHIRAPADQNAIQEFIFGVDPRGHNMSERETLEAKVPREVALVQQRAMNSFGWKNDPLDKGSTQDSEWHPCDYILHVASRSAHGRRDIMLQVLQNDSRSHC